MDAELTNLTQTKGHADVNTAVPTARTFELRDKLGLLTSAEVAALLDINVGTLANWRSRGYGPLPVKIGGRLMYSHRNLREWLDSHAF